MTPTQGRWLVPSSGRADSGKEGRLRPPLVWAPSPCWDPAARTPRGLQEGMGPGTHLHTRRACASCSELCPVPPRQGNCTLELQSDCLAQQLNAREMEQKAATSHWPRPCRESGMHTCPGRAWLCAHAHVLTLTLSVSGCTVLTSAARPYLQLCPLLFFTCPCDPVCLCPYESVSHIPMTPCPYDSVSPCLCVPVSPRLV